MGFEHSKNHQQVVNNVMNELSTKDCRHFGACSGCSLGASIDFPPIWQEVETFFLQAKLEGLEVGDFGGCRIKSKLAVRGTPQAPKIGLYKKNTHEVESIPSCLTHHPSINRAIEHINEAIRQERLPIYCESTNQGLLRYLQCFVDVLDQKVQLGLVVQEDNRSIRRFCDRLLRENLWHSIWLNIQPNKTNQVLGETWVPIFGEPFLYQPLGSRKYAFHPGAFAQANWNLFQKLAAYVKEKIPEGSRLLEIYAGVGVMGIYSSANCEVVNLVESNPFAYDSFLATDHPPHVFYHLGDAKDAIQLLSSADCIVVDPPRKGIDLQLLESIRNFQGKLIYVSCNFKSFRRDAEELKRSGWNLKEGKGFLFFPGTDHVEIVGIFDK